MSNHILKPLPTEQNTKALSSYLVGLVVSFILVFAISYIVQHRVFEGGELVASIAIFAVLEFITMVACFLRISSKTSDGRWDLLCLIFTMFIVAIVVTGSLWIMYNLNYYMVH